MGENCGYFNSSSAPSKSDTTWAVNVCNMWYNEIEKYDFGVKEYQQRTGHFTQVCGVFLQRTGHFTQVCGVICAENWTFHSGLWCILIRELDILLRFVVYFVQRTGHFTQVCGVFCAENWTFHSGLWCILCKELDILLRFVVYFVQRTGNFTQVCGVFCGVLQTMK